MSTLRSVLVPVFFFFACTAPAPYGTDPETAYSISGFCALRHECGSEYDQCVQSGASACRACIRLGDIGCNQLCNYVNECAGWHCDETDPCMRWRYTGQPGEEDPAVRESCERFVAHQVACGAEPPAPGACSLSAATERPEAAEAYDCAAVAACGAYDECSLSPDVEQASPICDSLRACGEWDVCDDGSLASLLGWLRPDVIDGLRSCSQLPCGQLEACVDAWAVSLTLE
jgi:hypothetical protein